MQRLILACALSMIPAAAQIAVRGTTVYTMSGAPIKEGVVLVKDGKIEKIGAASDVKIPSGYKVMQAAVVTPGLIDARATIGLTGYLNQPQDQDVLEKSAPLQPELRAIDAYDPNERLIEYVRGFGITTLHTGHGPGALISGQTMVIKTNATTADQAMIPLAMVVGNLGDDAKSKEAGKSPGTRAKQIAMLRSEFIKAQEYNRKAEKKDPKDAKDAARDLRTEMLGRVVKGEVPLLLTADRATDIMSAIRLAKEFNLKLVLDSAAEAHMVLDQIKAANVPVILHPTMYRAFGETENLSFETAAKLKKAGIPFALQSGYEGYVPKTRVVLWEAAIAAANGLSQNDALASITIDAARLLGIAARVGSLETGKDADIAMFDGDPFEYTSHCTGVVIDGAIASTEKR
jgi:imidazolonepropionase-like amidohydrolase